MTGFGDSDPEDAWDPDDPLPELVANIRRRLALLVALHRLDRHSQQRLEMAADDLEVIHRRALLEVTG